MLSMLYVLRSELTPRLPQGSNWLRFPSGLRAAAFAVEEGGGAELCLAPHSHPGQWWLVHRPTCSPRRAIGRSFQRQRLRLQLNPDKKTKPQNIMHKGSCDKLTRTLRIRAFHNNYFPFGAPPTPSFFVAQKLRTGVEIYLGLFESYDLGAILVFSFDVGVWFGRHLVAIRRVLWPC